MVKHLSTVGGVNDLLAVAEPTAEAPNTLLMLGLLIGIPLLVVAIVASIVLGPQWSRAGRWRPGQPWRDEPVWLGAGDPQRVSEVISYGAITLSVATAEGELTSVEEVEPEAEIRAPFVPGGARGRW